MAQRNINKASSETNSKFSRRSVLKSMGAAGAGVGIGGAGVGKFASKSARAVSTTSTSEHGFLVIDDFEDGELDEYSFDQGSSGASVASGVSYKGSQSLAISGTNTELISTAGLDYYPAAGDTFSFWIQSTGGAEDINLTYGVQDHQNRYLIRVDVVNDDLFLYRYENGSLTRLAGNASGYSLAEDTWYEVEIKWTTTGDQTATIYDTSGTKIASVAGTDSTWTKGGIGYDAYLSSSGGTVYFDHITKETSAPSNLVIDSFEDGGLSEYEFDRGASGAAVTTDAAYIGSQALEISGTNTELISMYGLDYYPSAGDLFSTWVRATGGADLVNITYGVQNHLNRYYARVAFGGGRIKIYRYEDGSSTLLAKQTGLNLSEDTWYEVEIDWKEDGTHIFTLYDSSGTQVSQISATDSTWSAGGVGYDAYLANGGTVYLDYARIKSGNGVYTLDQVIDDFENGSLNEYSFDRGSSGASVVGQPTWSGSKALKISGTDTEMISTSGLNYYPSAGDVFSCWVQGASGADDLNFSYGVQNHSDRYFVRLDFLNNNLQLYRYENGSSTLLAKDISVTVAENQWYNIEIDWRKTGTQIIRLYDASKTQVTQISASDATWSDGGIGYDAYLSDGGTVYFDYVSQKESVLDDFEDSDLDEYSGDIGSFTVQNSTVLDLTQSLKGTNASSAIAHSGVETPRGYEYSVLVMAESGSNPSLLTCVQDVQNPMNNCYYVSLDPTNNTLTLYRQDNGSTVQLEQNNVQIKEREIYQLAILMKPFSVHGIVRDLAGNTLGVAGEVDKTYYDGYLGLGLSGGAPSYYDRITRNLDVEQFIDTFEDGSLSEYTFGTSNYTIQSSTVISGDHSLKCENTHSAIVHDSIGITRGNQYRVYVKTGSNSEARPGILTCIQDKTSPMADCYWAQASVKYNELGLYRRENNSTVVLDRVSVPLEKDTVYQLSVRLFEDKLKATIYTEHGVHLAETELVNDEVYSSGGFALHTGGDIAPAYYDNVSRRRIDTHDMVTVKATASEAQEMLNNSLVSGVLTKLDNPSATPTAATRTNAYLNQSTYQRSSIVVPMEYGEIRATTTDGQIELVEASLNYSSMPDYLINELSGDFGWDGTTKAIMVNYKSATEPHFVRALSESEQTDLKNAITRETGRTDVPGGMTAINYAGGFYRGMYYNRTYDVDTGMTTIDKTHDRYETQDLCQEERQDCAVNTVLAVGGGVATALSCQAVILTLGGATPACYLSGALTAGASYTAVESCGDTLQYCP